MGVGQMGLFAGTKWDVPAHCEVCKHLESECTCPPPTPDQKVWLPPNKQTAKLAVERRKKGKMVTVIRGLDPTETDLPKLLTSLKNSCGAGGTIEDSTIEVQGSHIDRIQKLLLEMGYKISGVKS
jgi:translation initiation factor 1